MEPTLEELRKNYESFDDKKLIRIATEQATGLRPEAVVLLKQIIKERGISEDIGKGIDAQFEPINEATVMEYTDLLRRLPCPICNSTHEQLNATMTGNVVSFIIMTSYKKELKIACPDCLDKANDNAMIKTALFGWWGFPWGIIRTPQALILNNKIKKHNRITEPNALFKAFVLGRLGRIEANRNNPAELQDIIGHIR